MGDAASPNRVAIVTGAGGGIGLAIARRLEADGARVMFADLDEAAARKAAGKTGEAFWGDLSEEKVAGALIGQTVQTLGAPAILVNNAGGGILRPFLDHTPETLRPRSEARRVGKEWVSKYRLGCVLQH